MRTKLKFSENITHNCKGFHEASFIVVQTIGSTNDIQRSDVCLSVSTQAHHNESSICNYYYYHHYLRSNFKSMFLKLNLRTSTHYHHNNVVYGGKLETKYPMLLLKPLLMLSLTNDKAVKFNINGFVCLFFSI
jgi:hypothetical protein